MSVAGSIRRLTNITSLTVTEPIAGEVSEIDTPCLFGSEIKLRQQQNSIAANRSMAVAKDVDLTKSRTIVTKLEKARIAVEAAEADENATTKKIEQINAKLTELYKKFEEIEPSEQIAVIKAEIRTIEQAHVAALQSRGKLRCIRKAAQIKENEVIEEASRCGIVMGVPIEGYGVKPYLRTNNVVIGTPISSPDLVKPHKIFSDDMLPPKNISANKNAKNNNFFPRFSSFFTSILDGFRSAFRKLENFWFKIFDN